ncbi:type II toxin-antitoxin system VapC family toxin [Phreatobacter sp. HK31-P]
MARRFYCDSNVFIMAVEGAAERIGAAGALLDAAMDERCTAITSMLTLSETLVVPLRFGQGATIQSYRNLLGGGFPGIVVRGVDPETLEAAARLRARHPRLKLPDAIHLATAQLAEVGWLVTNDTRLPTLAGLRIVTPFDEMLVDFIARLSETP